MRGGQQDADVAEPRRTPAAVAVVDLPAVVDRGLHRVGDARRLARPQLVGRQPSFERFRSEQHHPRPALRIAPVGFEREVLGLGAFDRLDQPPEHVVDPVEHRGRGAEVGREPQRLGREVIARPRGTSRCRPGGSGRSTAWGRRRRRAVPGVTAVASQPCPPASGVVGREQRGDLDLDRVGVLELVDQQALVPVAQALADGRSPTGGRAAARGRARAGRGTPARPRCAVPRRGAPCRWRGTRRRGASAASVTRATIASRCSSRRAMRSRTSLTSRQFLRLPAFFTRNDGLSASSSSMRAASSTAVRIRPACSSNSPSRSSRRSSPSVHSDCAGAHGRQLRQPGLARSISGMGGGVVDAVEQVPVVVEELRNPAEVVHAGTRREQDQERLARGRGSSSSSSRVVRHRSSNASSDDTSSCTSMRGGKPASTGNAVSMRCAKACSVEIAASSSWSSAAFTAGPDRVGELLAARPLLELAAHAVAQLGRRLLGERDRRDRPHRHREAPTLGGDELDDSIDEHLGLAGSGTGLDEQRVVEVDARPPRGAGSSAVRRASRLLSDQRDVVGQLGRGALADPGAVRSRWCRDRRGRSTRTR